MLPHYRGGRGDRVRGHLQELYAVPSLQAGRVLGRVEPLRGLRRALADAEPGRDDGVVLVRRRPGGRPGAGTGPTQAAARHSRHQMVHNGPRELPRREERQLRGHGVEQAWADRRVRRGVLRPLSWGSRLQRVDLLRRGVPRQGRKRLRAEVRGGPRASGPEQGEVHPVGLRVPWADPGSTTAAATSSDLLGSHGALHRGGVQPGGHLHDRLQGRRLHSVPVVLRQHRQGQLGLPVQKGLRGGGRGDAGRPEAGRNGEVWPVPL